MAGIEGVLWVGRNISIQEVADIEQGKLRYFHYSTGHYEDDAGNVYPMDFS